MAICPICKSETKALDRVRDTEGFDCPQHDKFKVSGTALATKKDASREQWEAAFKRAKQRAAPGEWPKIMDGDF
jgi:hypothetical protein